ncbi:MAG: TIGR04086 family membrane protein [Clostridiales bacterium]|nr:TIGR04086 family membrane protein [Clostridiales bacterium]
MSKNNLSFFAKITIITAVFSLIFLLLLAGLMYTVHLSQSQISFGIFAIYIICCLIGGFLTGKKMKVRRFLWGLGFGSFYFLVLLLLSICFGSNVTENIRHILTVFAACTVSGLIGGIIG